MLNYLKANSECEHILKRESRQNLKFKFQILENGSANPIFDYNSLSIEAFGKLKVGQLKGFVVVRMASSIKISDQKCQISKGKNGQTNRE